MWPVAHVDICKNKEDQSLEIIIWIGQKNAATGDLGHVMWTKEPITLK